MKVQLRITVDNDKVYGLNEERERENEPFCWFEGVGIMQTNTKPFFGRLRRE